MVGARVLEQDVSLEDRISSLAALDDVADGLVRMPYNLVVSGELPHWSEPSRYDPSGYEGRSTRLFGPEAPKDAVRLPVVMLSYDFATKRSMLEGREDDADPLSVAGAGLYLPGADHPVPHGVFVLNAPPSKVYAVAMAYDDPRTVFFHPTKDGLERRHSPNREVPKPFRRLLDRASKSKDAWYGLEWIDQRM